MGYRSTCKIQFKKTLGIGSCGKGVSKKQLSDKFYQQQCYLQSGECRYDYQCNGLNRLSIGKKNAPIRPFFGGDAGISISSKRSIISKETATIINNLNKQTFVILAPKAGINILLSKGLGIFAQAQYNIAFGSGKPASISIIGFNNDSAKPVDKFFSFDTGIFFRFLGNSKKK